MLVAKWLQRPCVYVYECATEVGWKVMLFIKFGLVCRMCYAARRRSAPSKDDGKSVRSYVPNKFNNLFHDSQILLRNDSNFVSLCFY
jgi:hypothetical protein